MRKTLHSPEDEWHEIVEIHSRIEDIYKTRYRPFFASAGVFIVLAMAIAGYVGAIHDEASGDFKTLDKTMHHVNSSIVRNTAVIEGHIKRADQVKHEIEKDQARTEFRIDRLERNIGDQMRKRMKE